MHAIIFGIPYKIYNEGACEARESDIGKAENFLNRDSDVQENEKQTIKMPALARQSLGNQVADVLRAQILLGQLKPGDVIPERETSAALGVSRTPLREALLVLEAEGLIEMSPSKSPVVANPSLLELTEMLLVQSALEALAGEIACSKATQSDIEAIEEIHNKMVATAEDADPITFFQIDMSFHEAVVAASKNEALIKTHNRFHVRLWRARFLTAGKVTTREVSVADHASIVKGLRARDEEKVSGSMRDHLRKVIDNVTAMYAQQKT